MTLWWFNSINAPPVRATKARQIHMAHQTNFLDGMSGLTAEAAAEIASRRFDGPHDATKDERLSAQHIAIRNLMADGNWRTLNEISEAVEKQGIGCPPASASAQLRHLRKRRFGGHVVDKRHLGNGLYTYQLILKGAL